MNSATDVSDAEFVPFLQNLGVDTCKSFEWMLNDPAYADALRWIYNSLDHNNALTAREEYRYNEIVKQGAILSPEDLEAAVTSIQDEYPGICLPGDQDSIEDLEMDIQFQEERLKMLESQEVVVKDLIKQNEAIGDQLSRQLIELNLVNERCKDDEAEAAKECKAVAQEVDVLMDGLVTEIADNFNVYYSCKQDKEISKRFITFSPLEKYRHLQALLRSHHELYASKQFSNAPNAITDQLWTAVAEAKEMEHRLSDAALVYVKSKAELSGEQAKLSLVTKYRSIHPSQVTACLLEARSAMDLLEHEENLVDEEVRNAVKELVKGRTELAVESAMSAVLGVRHQILSSLTHLTDVWREAYALDSVLYYSLRHELRTLEEFVQFATELRQYAVDEANAVAVRMDSMNKIILDIASAQNLENTNPVLQLLFNILGVGDETDPSILVRVYDDLRKNLKELKDSAQEGFRRKENAIVEFKNSAILLRGYVWSGCTKRAHCWDSIVGSLSHSHKHRMEEVDRRIHDAADMFTRVKNGDKQKLRKLWQWFLTDPAKFQAALNICY